MKDRRRSDKVGIALAGGGPLGGIYEIGALAALEEALLGIKLTECDVYVGVSSGAFVAAVLASGFSPSQIHAMFILGVPNTIRSRRICCCGQRSASSRGEWQGYRNYWL